jgi:hypothetical protein
MAMWSVCLLIALASVGRGAPTNSKSSQGLGTQILPPVAIADFDGDRKPDIAMVQAGELSSSVVRYWIRFQLSAAANPQDVGITASVGGLQITPRDVNGDNILDLVVTTSWLNEPVVVLLNDGHGKFTVSDPTVFPAAMWRVDASWYPAVTQIKDAAALLTRPLYGQRSEAKGEVLGLPPRQSVEIGRCGSAFSLPLFSVLGRAPPATNL